MSEEKCWYVVHTQTGHEDKVREKILLNVDSQNFGDRIFNVLVPTEEVVEVKQNKKSYVNANSSPVMCWCRCY